MSNVAPLLVPVALPVGQSAAPHGGGATPSCHGVTPYILVQVGAGGGGVLESVQSRGRGLSLLCLGWLSWCEGGGGEKWGAGGAIAAPWRGVKSSAGWGGVWGAVHPSSLQGGWEQLQLLPSEWGAAVPP